MILTGRHAAHGPRSSRLPWGIAGLVMFASAIPTFAHDRLLGDTAKQADVRRNLRDSVTAFVDVAVIPMDREQVLTGQTVVVQGHQIIAMGLASQIQVPPGAVRIDGRGKFLIPGLVDMHAHVPGLPRSVAMAVGGATFDSATTAEAERMLFLFAANGVTTIRVMYGWAATLALRERVAAKELLGPRLYVAAGPIDMGWGAPSPDSAVRFVEAAKAAGYDFVKLHGMDGEPFDSAVATARRVGIPIAGHAPDTPDGLEQALQAGYASIEHLSGIDRYLLGGEFSSWGLGQWPTPSPLDQTKLRTMATRIQQTGIWHCPTEILWDVFLLPLDTLAAWPEMRYVTDSMLAWWREKAPLSWPDRPAMAMPFIDERRAVIRALRDAGAGLLLGTDDATPFLVPGFSLHRELEALVTAGLTPYQALAAGTRNAAAYFGTLDSTGTVAVGKRADLVLLTGNPLEDIRHTAHPAGVMLDGRWLGRAELDAGLAALEGKAF